MNFIKAMGAIALVGVAAGIVIKNELEEKKKNQELDEFLLSDETEPVVVDIPVENAMEKDILTIKSSPATLHFSCQDKEQCLAFQDLLSQKGLSSDLSSDELKVDVIFNQEVNEESLRELVKDVQDVLDKVEAKYEGCH